MADKTPLGLTRSFKTALAKNDAQLIEALSVQLRALSFTAQQRMLRTYLQSECALPVRTLVEALPDAKWLSEGFWRSAQSGEVDRLRELFECFPHMEGTAEMTLEWAVYSFQAEAVVFLWPKVYPRDQASSLHKVLETMDFLHKRQQGGLDQASDLLDWMTERVAPSWVLERFSSQGPYGSWYDQALARAIEKGIWVDHPLRSDLVLSTAAQKAFELAARTEPALAVRRRQGL